MMVEDTFLLTSMSIFNPIIDIIFLASYHYNFKGKEVDWHWSTGTFTVINYCAWHARRCKGLFIVNPSTSQVWLWVGYLPSLWFWLWILYDVYFCYCCKISHSTAAFSLPPPPFFLIHVHLTLKFINYNSLIDIILLGRDEFWDLYKNYFHQRLVQGDLRILLFGPMPNSNMLRGKRRKRAPDE